MYQRNNLLTRNDIVRRVWAPAVLETTSIVMILNPNLARGTFVATVAAVPKYRIANIITERNRSV